MLKVLGTGRGTMSKMCICRRNDGVWTLAHGKGFDPSDMCMLLYVSKIVTEQEGKEKIDERYESIMNFLSPDYNVLGANVPLSFR